MATINSTMLVDKKQHYVFAPKDADGVSRDVTGLKGNVLSGDATVAIDADGKGAFIIPSETPGDSVVEFVADADLTEGGEALVSDTVNVTATALPIPQAVTLGTTADGEPVAK